MKALFVGLGSIGQRHLVNFRQLLGKRAEIIACRSTGHNIFIHNGFGKKVISLRKSLGFKEINDIEMALKERADVVFITSPTSKHMGAALKAAKCGSNIFIEKPLSDNLKGVNNLKKIAKHKGLIIMIGYQMRFHPCYKLVKSILSGHKYGNLISASFEWGTYLPRHHSYEDYRKGYAAVKSLGGGVVLGLIHELDMICSLLGQPKNISAIGGKLSSLKINTEDTVSVLMGFKRQAKIFPVTLFLSYAQTKETRKFRIQLDKGTIFCDLLENSIEIFSSNDRLIMRKSFPNFKRNALFLEEMKEFLSAVKQKRKPIVTLDDGIRSLKLALQIKEAIK